MKILCPSEESGNVLVYARMWGPVKVEAVKKAFGIAPAQIYRFTGQLTQFKDRDRVLTGFNLFDFQPTTETVGLRAAFILGGELEERDDIDNGLAVLKVHIKQDGEFPMDDVFEVYATEKEADKVSVLDHVIVKGKMRDMDAEWGSSGDLRPVADEVKPLTKKEPF